MLKNCVGLKEVEDFVKHERGKFKGGGGMKKKQNLMKHRAIVKKFMDDKLRDARGHCISLRKDKSRCLKNLETKLEGNRKEIERIKKEVKAQVKKIKTKLPADRTPKR